MKTYSRVLREEGRDEAILSKKVKEDIIIDQDKLHWTYQRGRENL